MECLDVETRLDVLLDDNNKLDIHLHYQSMLSSYYTHTRVETTCHINFPPKKSKVATSYLHVRKNKVDYSKMRNDSLCRKDIQCPPLNRITLGQRKSENNNRMIQLTNVF